MADITTVMQLFSSAVELVEQPFGQRAVRWRKLTRGGVDVRAQLRAGVCQIADSLNVIQGDPVVFQQRR